MGDSLYGREDIATGFNFDWAVMQGDAGLKNCLHKDSLDTHSSDGQKDKKICDYDQYSTLRWPEQSVLNQTNVHTVLSSNLFASYWPFML